MSHIEYNVPGQINLATVNTFYLGKPVPIVAERIWDTKAHAEAYINDSDGSAFPGMRISVTMDGNNNGLYYVKGTLNSSTNLLERPFALIKVKDTNDADMNTWRSVYSNGTLRGDNSTDSKGLNLTAGSNVSLSYAPAGTGTGQSGNANYFNIKISASDTNTWRNVYTDGISRIGTDIESKAINYKAGDNITIDYEAEGTDSNDYFSLKFSATDTNTWRGIYVDNSLKADTGTNTKGLNLKAGNNITLAYNAGTSDYFNVEINATDTNTATATDTILHGSNNGTEITYAPYTTQQTAKLSFDTSTSEPTWTDRLNLNGYLYATYFKVRANRYKSTNAFGMDMNNSDIANANSILFKDTSELGEGLHFRRANTGDAYDTVRANAGHLYFDKDVNMPDGSAASFNTGGGTEEILHTGNTLWDTTNTNIQIGPKLKVTGGSNVTFTPTTTDGVTTVEIGVTGGGGGTDTDTWRNVYVNGNSRVGTNIASKAINFSQGNNVTIDYQAAGTESGQSGDNSYFNIKISATDTNTATAADAILHGSNSGTEITYAPYTTQQTKLSFDTSTTEPTRIDRLNLNGYLHATYLRVRANRYKSQSTEPRFGLDMNNSDIINANSILFQEVSDKGKGLHFIRSNNGNTYDSIRANGGRLYFDKNISITDGSTTYGGNTYDVAVSASNVTMASGSFPEASSTTGRYYRVETDTTTGYAVVNVPWTGGSGGTVNDSTITLKGGNSTTSSTWSGSFTTNAASNTTIYIPTMTGASSSANGEMGLVPKPSNGDENKYLRGDGSWQNISTGTTDSFKTIEVSGQSSVVADTSTDTLTLVAGNGMSITTDASTDTITFTSTGSGSSNIQHMKMYYLIDTERNSPYNSFESLCFLFSDIFNDKETNDIHAFVQAKISESGGLDGHIPLGAVILLYGMYLIDIGLTTGRFIYESVGFDDHFNYIIATNDGPSMWGGTNCTTQTLLTDSNIYLTTANWDGQLPNDINEYNAGAAGQAGTYTATVNNQSVTINIPSIGGSNNSHIWHKYTFNFANVSQGELYNDTTMGGKLQMFINTIKTAPQDAESYFFSNFNDITMNFFYFNDKTETGHLPGMLVTVQHESSIGYDARLY